MSNIAVCEDMQLVMSHNNITFEDMHHPELISLPMSTFIALEHPHWYPQVVDILTDDYAISPR